jgi:transketolase
VAEDHWYQSGLGDAVLEALVDAHSSARIRRLAVEAMPTSGGPEELLRWAGIDAPSIAAAAQDLLKSGTEHGTVRAEFPVS